jgi:hypothetical protein
VQDRAHGRRRADRRAARRRDRARHQPGRPRRLPPRHRRRARLRRGHADGRRRPPQGRDPDPVEGTWDKPQLACLSSRFPYGTQITPERLRRVDDFEDGLRALGLRECRVRFHDTVARLEVPVDDLARLVTPGVRDEVVALGKRAGFTYVAVDLAGFRSGSANEVPLVALGRKRPGGPVS